MSAIYKSTMPRLPPPLSDVQATEHRHADASVVPQDWLLRPVGKMGEVLAGKALAARAPGAQRPYLRTKNVFDGRIDLSDVLSMPMTDAQFARYQLQRGDVLLNEGQSLDLVGRCAMYDDEFGAPCAIQNQLVRFRANVGVSPSFAAQLFRYCQHSGVFARIAMQTTSVAHLGVSRFARLSLSWPTDEFEQNAISQALSDVDELLGALEKVFIKKRAIKQATMQQLLTGKTRLPGFTGKWGKKRLGEISTIAMGRTPSRSNAAFWGRGHVWLSIADLQDKVVSASREQITELAASGMTPISKGTLLMSFKLSIGRLCFAGCDLFTNEAICSVTNPQADADFLYYALSRTDFSLYGKQAVKGYTLNRESLKQVEVWLPEREEQIAIATVLSDMDAEIAALERRRDKVKQVRQGMMQQLLTGRIRLIKPESQAHGTKVDADGKTGKSHSWAFNEAVVISTLAKHFGKEEFPLGRKRYTKLSYLLHRHAEKRAEGYLKKAAGPYNPRTKYGGPEKIAVENGYVREHKNGPYTGFVASDNIAQAEGYFEKWYGPEAIQWLNQFRFKKNDELELLATVDMAAEELRSAGKIVDVHGVKAVIRSHPEWKAKLDRAIFSDANINDAIHTSRKLFECEGEPTDGQ